MLLVTITLSHSCDRARWVLDRHGVAYREIGTFPVMHLPLVAWLVGPGRANTNASPFATPVLRLDDGRVIRDSRRIARWVAHHHGADRLYPNGEVVSWEDRLERLGGITRRLVYAAGLIRPDMLRWMADHNLGRGHRLLVRGALPAVRAGLVRGLGARPQVVSRLRDRLMATLDGLASDVERPYLTADRFTAADIALATMLAPMIAPPSYGAALPPIDLLPDTLAALVGEVREHPVGRRAMAHYREERTTLEVMC